MDKLEHFLTQYYDGQFCAVFARGSTGLYVLFEALRELKGPGEVIVPAICCETIPMAVLYAGLKPVIADVDIHNLCLRHDSVQQKLSGRTVAIVLVYIFGHPFDPAPYHRLKAAHDIVLIEDIAQAVGGYDAGQRLGQRFDFTLLSFADEKIIRGRGGAIVQRNPQYGNILSSATLSLPPSPKPHILRRKEQSLRNLVHALYDLARTDESINISETFYKMIPYYKDMIVRQRTATDSDQIIDQFERLEEEQGQRYEKYKYYVDHIQNDLLEAIEFPPGAICWRLPILVRDAVNTFYLTAMLRTNGVLASNHYFPLDKLLGHSREPNAASVTSRILNLWVDDLVTMDRVKKTVALLNTYRPIG